MKKLLLCLAIAAFTFSGIHAQGPKFGIKGGLNLSTITGDDTDDIKMRTTFHIGAVAEIGISEKFAIQPEVLYSAQGGVIDTADNPVVQYDYINVPLMGKYYLSEKFSIEFGPQVGFNINAKLKLDDVEIDLSEGVSKIDFGANLGLGYKLSERLFANARYNLGLSNINGDEDDPTEIRNSVIQVSVGYMF